MERKPLAARVRVGIRIGRRLADADDRLLVAGVVDQDPVAARHRAEVLARERVRDAVPGRPSVALELRERVTARFGLEEPIRHAVSPAAAAS